MSEFDDALSEGLEAYRDATRAKSEIKEVIRELSAAVGRKTQQRVFVIAARVEKTTMLSGLASMMQRSIDVISNQLPEPEIPDALFAVRRGAENGQRAQLCRLKIGVEGYPVEITVAGQFLHAHNREGLAASLVQLLRHPDVAGKIARVAELRGDEPASETPAIGAGPSPSTQTAEQAKPWLEAEGEADREKGYRIISDAIQHQEELDPSVRAHLKNVLLDTARPLGDRTRCVQLLAQADRLDDETRHALASLWFEEPNITMAFSSALSGVFDRRRYLPPLLAVLQRVTLPQDDEPTATTDTASHGDRVSQAFGSIRSAATLDRETPLDDNLRSEIRELCSRYRSVASVVPLIEEIQTSIAS